MKVMVSCGEVSGDLYAGALVAEIRRRVPDAEVFGFGGDRFEAAGGRLLGHFRGLTVTGLTEALRVVPRSYVMLRKLVAAARQHNPDVFVPIDFPDFNFRLMAAIHRLGIPVVYYVSPQLWAWRQGRMASMKADVDKVLVIFPFEAQYYESAGVPVEFVGHPLVDLAHAVQPRSAFLRDRGLVPDAPTVALLPGSRPNEVERIAPAMVAALPLIRQQVHDVQFVVACAPGLPDVLFAPFLTGPANHLRQGRVAARRDEPAPPSRSAAADRPGGPPKRPAKAEAGPDDRNVSGGPYDRSGARHSHSHVGAGFSRPVLAHDRTDDVLAACDVVITASGTATVQAALHERPMVVVYRLSPLTYHLGKPFVAVDMYAMPNLVAGRRIVPELIQADCTPERIAAETASFLSDRELHARTREALRRVREKLGAAGASARAADAILEVARRRRGASSA